MKIKHHSLNRTLLSCIFLGFLNANPTLVDAQQNDNISWSLTPWSTLSTDFPALSNSAGWTDPDNYETIQALSINDELHLLARSDNGIYTYKWDGNNWITLAEKTPRLSNNKGWDDPANYRTIQALQTGDSLYLLGRGDSGIYLYRWFENEWSLLTASNPTWSDENGWADPSNYETIQALDVGGTLHLVARANEGIIVLKWSNNAWTKPTQDTLAWSDTAGWDKPSNYKTIQALEVDGALHIVARGNFGIKVVKLEKGKWITLAEGIPKWSNRSGWNDAPNYETIQALVVDDILHLVGRGNQGLMVVRWDNGSWIRLEGGMLDWSDSEGWADAANFKTIQALEVDQQLYIVARSNTGILVSRWNNSDSKWISLASGSPAWTDKSGWADESYYGTIRAVEIKGVLHLMTRGDDGMLLLSK